MYKLRNLIHYFMFTSVNHEYTCFTGWEVKPEIQLQNIQKDMCVETEHCGAFALLLLPCKSKKYYMFCVYVCSFSYPEYQAHVPSCIVICDLYVFTIFFCTHFKKATVFGYSLLKINMYVWNFSTTSVWEFSDIIS